PVGHGGLPGRTPPPADAEPRASAGAATPAGPAEERSAVAVTERSGDDHTAGAPEAEPSESPEPPEPRPEPVQRGRVWTFLRANGPYVVMGLVIVFNLWALHPNAYTTTY